MLALKVAEELVGSRKLLLAFLLDGTATQDEQAWLPVELQRVLLLPEVPRQCFVLRILAGWPTAQCAAALVIPAKTVDEESCVAAQRLARLTAMEK